MKNEQLMIEYLLKTLEKGWYIIETDYKLESMALLREDDYGSMVWELPELWSSHWEYEFLIKENINLVKKMDLKQAIIKNEIS